jgi:septal ring factor EnvC (AmiA/AmiB activator)
MNKFYFIFPVVLLIVFGVYYTQVAQPAMAAQVLVEQKRLAAQQAAEDARRKDIELKAQEDARKAQAARDEKEREHQEKLRAEKEQQERDLRAETAKYENDAARLNKQIADLEIAITSLRNQREETKREAFELAKKVELAKIDRRTAETEIQRMYEMVAQKIADSTLTQVPPLPAK